MARSRGNKIELTAYDDLFETDESRAEAALSKIREIPISEIDEFPDHPFKVLMDEDTVIVAAITSRAYSKVRLPTHTQVTDFEGLDKESVVLLEQIRTLDKKRLIKYMGLMPGNVMARVDKALAISIALVKK